MSRSDLDGGAVRVEELLANDQPGLFAAIGELGWYSGIHRRWIDDLALPAGDRVLEVGCATGILTSYMTEGGYLVTGLDRSDDMVARARNDHPDLDVLVGDATQISHDDDVFDAVVAASVINVVDDAELVLSEMHRVCRPGGTVSVLAPQAGFTDEDHDSLIEGLSLTGFSRAVLTKWHKGPAKMRTSQLESLFRSVELEPATTCSYLDGMLIAASATARSG